LTAQLGELDLKMEAARDSYERSSTLQKIDYIQEYDEGGAMIYREARISNEVDMEATKEFQEELERIYLTAGEVLTENSPEVQ
jgi:hypothetical protein